MQKQIHFFYFYNGANSASARSGSGKRRIAGPAPVICSKLFAMRAEENMCTVPPLFAISSVTRTHILRCATFFVRNTASVIKSLSTAFNSSPP